MSDIIKKYIITKKFVCVEGTGPTDVNRTAYTLTRTSFATTMYVVTTKIASHKHSGEEVLKEHTLSLFTGCTLSTIINQKTEWGLFNVWQNIPIA